MLSHNPSVMLLAGVCAGLLACSTDTPVEPKTPPAAAGPSFEIDDGAHGGNAHFFFLPPLVPTPAYSGAADPNLLGSLAVEVCDLGTSRPPTNTSCGSNPVFVARFTSTGGTASETLRYDAGAGLYIVNWHTDKSDGGTLATTRYYRLRVLAAGTVLGQADIDPVRSASDLKNYDTGNSIPLVNGRTLPIKFRVETGAVFPIGTGGGVAKTSDGSAAVAIPAAALPAGIGITVAPAALPPAEVAGTGVLGTTAFEFGPTGTQFAVPATLSLTYAPEQLPPGVDEADLRLYTLVGGQWSLVPGSGVDVNANMVTGNISHFSVYSVGVRAASASLASAWIPVAPGATTQLEATSRDPDGNLLENRATTWTSSNPAVAAVSAAGVASGVARGLAKLTATVEGISDDVQVLVQVPSTLPDKLAWHSRRDPLSSVYQLAADGATVFRITNGFADGAYPTWRRPTQRILFSTLRDGNEEIYAMDPDGLGVTRLMNHPFIDREPELSPDASSVVFTSNRTGNFEIFRMPADLSGPPVNLTNDGGFDGEAHWSPNGTRIAFNSCRPGCDLHLMRADGSGDSLVASHPANDGQVSWSPDGTKLAWTSDRDGNFEIYRVDLSTGVITRLTSNAALDQMPVWSPDGSKIAFMSQRDGNEEIYVMNADGSGQARVTNHPARDNRPAWADNSTLVFSSGRSNVTFQLFRVRTDGTDLQLIQNNPIQAQEPDWSPDGSRLTFISNRDGDPDIYRINADGSGLVNLTNSGEFESEPHWSADGTRITFSSCRAAGCDVYVMNADGGAEARVTTYPGNDGQSNFSPAGTRVTWTTDRDGNFEIYSGNVDGTGAARLTNHPAFDFFPEWSPDGTRIAFTSQRDGNEEIYVMNADGTDPVRLTNDPGIDTRPSWSPDGRRLTFTSSREGNFKVFVMNDDGSGVMRVTDHPAGDGYSTWRP
jgi:Tol biopolymer transport system component